MTDKIFDIFKMISAGAAVVITYMFGGLDVLFKVFLAFLILDYVTGVLAAVYTKTMSSEIGFKGILKKVVILAIVAVSHLIGNAVGVPEIRSLVLGFYIANEGISILENAGRMGIPLPQKLKMMLDQLKEEAE